MMEVAARGEDWPGWSLTRGRGEIISPEEAKMFAVELIRGSRFLSRPSPLLSRQVVGVMQDFIRPG